MKNLNEILNFLGLPSEDPRYSEITIDSLTLNSQEAAPGVLFCALQGLQHDGHDFIEEAIAQGCSAILCENPKNGGVKAPIPIIAVPHFKTLLGKLANFCFPLKPNLKLIAVTGTNGKTSVTHFVAEALTLLGIETGLVGTLNGNLTTPNRFELAKRLSTLPSVVAIEASSHALDQNRLSDLPIEVAVFTNLSHDHLDYHLTFEHYQAAKAKLFTGTNLPFAVLNQDDSLCAFLKRSLSPKTRCLTYSVKDSTADIYVQSQQIFPDEHKTALRIHTPRGEMTTELFLLGEFNLSNALATLSVLLHFGFSPQQLQPILPQLHAPKGRMEKIPLAQGAIAVIDYAHTPDAMEKVLRTLKPYSSRLICIFGCGGNRDRLKRPKMAEIAEQYASWVIVTEDNSRFEPEVQIFEDIRQGFKTLNYEIIPSRKDAILKAVSLSKPGDIILLAGKGHETYLDKQGQKKPFDERDILQQAYSP